MLAENHQAENGSETKLPIFLYSKLLTFVGPDTSGLVGVALLGKKFGQFDAAHKRTTVARRSYSKADILSALAEDTAFVLGPEPDEAAGNADDNDDPTFAHFL